MILHRFLHLTSMLCLVFATNGARSQPMVESERSPWGRALSVREDSSERKSSVWGDAGIGLASSGFIYRGGIHLMLRPVILSIGAGQVSGKSGINISGEWERTSTVHAMASYVITPPGTRVMASFGAGVGFGQYEERALVTGSTWLLDPIYETRTAAVVDVPLQFTANFAVRSNIGLFAGIDAHLNREMPTAGLVVGVRFAPIE
jgi:hypothetical protein